MDRFLFFLLVLLVAPTSAGGVFRSDDPPPERGKTIAIIIAIGEYGDGTRVPYAESSAVAFTRIIARQGVGPESIVTLVGASATRDRLRAAFRDLSRLGPDDRVIIYFAGRAYTEPDTINPEGGLVAFGASSIDTRFLSAPRMAGGVSRIPWAAVRLFLTDTPAAGVVFFFDGTGGGVPAGPFLQDSSHAREGHQTRIIVMAGGERDSASWDQTTGISTFVHTIGSAFEDNVADANGDAEVTGSELAEFLRAELPGRSGFTERGIVRSWLPRNGEFRFPRGGREGVRREEGPDIRPGKLRLLSRPEGASVQIDGNLMGVTPLTLPEVPTGPHAILFRKEGYVDEIGTAVVRPGGFGTYSRFLERAMFLEILSDPPGAQASIDHRIVGFTPLFLSDVPQGERFVELARPGYHPSQTVIRSFSSDTIHLSRRLTDMYGSLRLQANRAPVVALLDGEPISIPPGDSLKVLTGGHRLSVSDPASGAEGVAPLEVGPSKRLLVRAELNYFSVTKCFGGILLPGMNQASDGDLLTGVALFLANAGSLVFVLGAQGTLTDARSAYDLARAEYLRAANETEAITTRGAMSAAHADLSSKTRTRNIALSVFAGAFVANALHTILFHSLRSDLTITPYVPLRTTSLSSIGGPGVQYGIALAF